MPGGRRGSLRPPDARSAGRQIDDHACGQESRRLALVRRCARVRQRTPPSGSDRDGPGDSHAALRRGRSAIAALAHVGADDTIGLLQAGRDSKLRQNTPKARGVRSAAGRSGRNDFRVPFSVASGPRRRVAGGGNAGVRLVFRRERPAHTTDRSRYGQLLGRTPPGSSQREQGRRIGAVVSSWSRGDTAVQARRDDRPKETNISGGKPSRRSRHHTANEPRGPPCLNPNS